jgi:antirestriction protein ArdC
MERFKMAVTKLNPELARSFDTFSEVNYETLKETLECGCEPYKEVFTFKRWKAQGYYVRKGEKAHKIIVVVKSEKENKKGEKEEKSFPKKTSVFCKCQVEKMEEKKGGGA